jgi:hypothetical protein
MNAVVTTYLTLESRSEDWGDGFHGFDSTTCHFNKIEKYYNSVLNQDLNCFILQSRFDEKTIQQYETSKIKFPKYTPIGTNILDVRWKVYHDFLIDNPNIENVFFTDSFDVTVLKSPFPFIESGKIYCGDEQICNACNKWMTRRFAWFKNQEIINEYTNYDKKQILNCGILGGGRKDMLDITKKMYELLAEADIKHTTVDMITFNHILYKYYEDRLIHGMPVNTLFCANDINNKEAWFQHK